MSTALRFTGRTKAGFVAFRGRERSSMFVKRGREVEYIRSGSLFRRRYSGRTIETARVLSVTTDGSGIPHVRYEVAFGWPTTKLGFEGPRTLALSMFIDSYPDRVTA